MLQINNKRTPEPKVEGSNPPGHNGAQKSPTQPTFDQQAKACTIERRSGAFSFAPAEVAGQKSGLRGGFCAPPRKQGD